MSILSRAEQVRSLVLFKLRQRSLSIPEHPCFGSPESTDYFQSELSAIDYYVEYGAGGSTVLAAQMNKQFVSVETDRFFLSRLHKKINREVGKCSGTLIHSNIGVTEKWGAPF